MRFFATIKILKFDDKQYSETMRKQLMIEFRKAAVAFLEAAAPRVPVETGMARGAFLNLARLLKKTLTITPRLTNQRYYHGGTLSKGLIKNAELGAAFTTPQDKILTWNEDRTKIRFTFNTRIYHFNLNDGFNDFGGVNANAPWGSLEAGKDAFISALRAIPLNKKLPKIKNFIIKTTISLGSGNNVTYGPEVNTSPSRSNVNV